MSIAEHDRLLTTKAAAHYLGMTQRFLEARRVRGGGPPFIRVSGNRIRYSLADLREWVTARRMVSTSERPGGGL